MLLKYIKYEIVLCFKFRSQTCIMVADIYLCWCWHILSQGVRPTCCVLNTLFSGPIKNVPPPSLLPWDVGMPASWPDNMTSQPTIWF
jgi:hypothetical protein